MKLWDDDDEESCSTCSRGCNDDEHEEMKYNGSIRGNLVEIGCMAELKCYFGG